MIRAASALMAEKRLRSHIGREFTGNAKEVKGSLPLAAADLDNTDLGTSSVGIWKGTEWQ